MEGALDLEALILARRPLADAAVALDELEAGRALRTLLVMPQAVTPTAPTT